MNRRMKLSRLPAALLLVVEKEFQRHVRIVYYNTHLGIDVG